MVETVYNDIGVIPIIDYYQNYTNYLIPFSNAYLI